MTARARRWIAAALIATAPLVLAAVAGGCGAERRGPPAAPSVVPAAVEERRGERLFFRFCYQCHPGGGGGLGPSINDKPLPHALIRAQIRRGLGEMPAFPDQVLSDEDVDAIIAYLDLLEDSPAATWER
ncbi:MAG TPA: cytochrome c [Kofleriaceae bacterium]|nr:cytochrome c [Kofleriaceae bacterium]